MSPDETQIAAPPKPWEGRAEHRDSVLNYIQPDAAAPTADYQGGGRTSAHYAPQQTPPSSLSASYYNHFPSPYNFNGYSQPYYGGAAMPGGLFAYGGPNSGYGAPSLPDQFLPPGTVLGAAEQRIRAALSAFGSIVRAVGSLAQMMDSTVYAAWSSVMAVVAVGEQFRQLRHEHLQRWMQLLRSAVSWLLGVLRLRSGAKAPLAVPFAIAQRDAAHSSAAAALSAQTRGPALSLAPVLQIFVPALIAGISYLAIREYVAKGAARGPAARVLYTFATADPSCIAVEAGEDIVVLQGANAAGWLLGRRTRDGREGFLPAAFVKIVESRQ